MKENNTSMENLYKLDGKVPILKAIPLGLQHILTMFIAGIATLIQLYPIWKIGSRLPIVMGVNFTFVAILTYVGATYGYASAMGAVLISGLIEGCLGLLARYWKKIITPIVAASVVTSIGFSLFLLEHVLLVEVTVKVLALLKIYF